MTVPWRVTASSSVTWDENVSVSGGQLLFTAEKRDFTCPKINKTYHYASGAVTTLDHFSQTYGYFEMRVKMPNGQGFWPAFWLLPTSLAWPPEIDIFESYMGQPASTTNTFHWIDNGHQMNYAAFKLSDQSLNYHTFGLDWQKGLMIFYIDGKEVRRIASAFVPSESMYILANLAIQGGNDGPTASVKFPQAMQIDYIRAFARVSDGTDDKLPPTSTAAAPAPAASAPAPTVPAPSVPKPSVPAPTPAPTPVPVPVPVPVPTVPKPSAPAPSVPKPSAPRTQRPRAQRSRTDRHLDFDHQVVGGPDQGRGFGFDSGRGGHQVRERGGVRRVEQLRQSFDGRDAR